MKGFNREKYLLATQLLSKNSKYNLTKTCGDCGNMDEIKLTRLQAMFELYDFRIIWDTPCSKCQSTNCSLLSQNTIT